MSFLNKIKFKKRIYLDYASMTPVDPVVIKKMREYEGKNFANPSALYNEALKAKAALNESREKIANILNTQKKSIVFTSGGTEGNNLAILGVFEALGGRASKLKPHIITTAIEHSSILEVCDEIERRGGEVTRLPVSKDGVVSPKAVKEAIKENTVLVSIMYANNEIGTIQAIKEIGKLIKEYRNKNNISNLYFHTDACQAGLYLNLDVQSLGVDLLTLDGIKIYGPKSTGFLYVRDGVEIRPVLFGGGQENGLRSGTENVLGAVGLACALEIAMNEKEKESERLIDIRDYAIESILKTFPNATLNGSKENRLPNNINICFPAYAGRPGLDAEFAVISLDVLGISASYSSSCRNIKEDSSSYVVSALGKKDCGESSLRFTLGRESKKSDIDKLVTALKKITHSAR